ncbi:hypothetical protein MPTK1_8g07650 [Marchantia polymorpha subsp. ruderalis]|uniref:Uncharacterized protein n=1 Tax=Marchantia polymorpha TaxID=3197 RepID=A0A2R6XI49_MARPO|nr:hypothetical protein MARPO_0013s0030 [Marchantia polymorpha]PTQ45777.1 hypothetical protein MARPO_0013s0030 [Marchantia polymorpha]BBN19067.1 hypothetical protein Mp_8g07650 [Marchantia polymorpha subsp. ruderalis]BBN19068.1 hypothetical protein Mp_8g07650 [Marchantia polymorpha subsp. ruderalis]|eukprot:PTQ45776.1 hypothetical protein MARPO_0013s0030 [Marchantia polymorpha]
MANRGGGRQLEVRDLQQYVATEREDLPSFGYEQSQSSGNFVRFVGEAERLLQGQLASTPAARQEAFQRALRLLAQRQDANEAVQYNNHVPPPQHVAGYPQRRDIPPVRAPSQQPTPTRTPTPSWNGGYMYDSSTSTGSSYDSAPPPTSPRKPHWSDGMDFTEYCFYSRPPPHLPYPPHQPELEAPGDLIMFDLHPEDSTTSRNSRPGRVHYDGKGPLGPGDRPDRFDAPASPESSNSSDRHYQDSSDPHFQDNMALGEIRFYTRQDMLGDLELPNQAEIDEELQFVYKLYQQRLYGQAQHCDMSCDTTKDPITCCWKSKWAEMEQKMRTSEPDSHIRRKLILDQYTRDIRFTVFKHIRRAQMWPEQYPKDLEMELEKFYHTCKNPSGEDYWRCGKETGLGSEGVVHYIEERRKKNALTNASDPHYEDNMALGEIRFYTRQDMLGELQLVNSADMDEELQFVYELYKQRLYGQARHCDMSCDTTKDPITCCWKSKWAEVEQQQDPDEKKQLILNQYTRDIRSTVFKHIRRNELWPENYPDDLYDELEKFYDTCKNPSGEDYRRCGKETGLGSEGVMHYVEERRKQRHQ